MVCGKGILRVVICRTDCIEYWTHITCFIAGVSEVKTNLIFMLFMNIIIGGMIYYCFVKVYDPKMQEQNSKLNLIVCILTLKSSKYNTHIGHLVIISITLVLLTQI